MLRLGSATAMEYDWLMPRKADFYRNRAEESRAMAANSRSEQARYTLLSIADQYEELARKAEDRDD